MLLILLIFLHRILYTRTHSVVSIIVFSILAYYSTTITLVVSNDSGAHVTLAS